MIDYFLESLAWLWPVEGGWYDGSSPRDRNPTMYGVTQATYIEGGYSGSVRHITKEQAKDIYWRLFWVRAKCAIYAWPVALVHFDAAVNHGPGNARKLWARAGGTWQGYIAARRAFYAAIIANNPDMAGNKNGWENRMKRLEQTCANATSG